MLNADLINVRTRLYQSIHDSCSIVTSCLHQEGKTEGVARIRVDSGFHRNVDDTRIWVVSDQSEDDALWIHVS